ncbi:MAG: alpha/beta hydrolase [Aureispira sp.]|nr:alpha/beta hydrolase [Aureispira sp.]
MSQKMFCIYQNKKVAYQLLGKGDVLVLLHGFCEDSIMWADFVQALHNKYTVLTIDLSGFGDSDLLEECSMEAMAKAVNAVLEVLEIEKCCMIGHSMGGYVGLAFAEIFGDKLLGLGLFHSHPYEDTKQKKANREKTIGFIERHGVAPFAAQFVKALFTPLFVKANRDYIEDLIQHTAEYHSDAVIAASRAMIARTDKQTVLEQIACPVLYIVGKEDTFIDYTRSLEQTILPNSAVIHILDGIGHMGMVEARILSLEIVVEFMEYITT